MNNKKGFTLIELLLVVMIIGFMLAIILPRGLRATTDAKYNLVRQNAAELAAFGNDWVEQQILAQDEHSTATRANYLDSLVSRSNNGSILGTNFATWVAYDTTRSNWNKYGANGNGRITVLGRYMNDPLAATNAYPENTVEEIIEPGKVLRNPFNGGSIFLSGPNLPVATPIPGALACGRAADSSTGGTFDYYAFVFQGTDSTGAGINPQVAAVDFHGGMDSGGNAGTPAQLAGLRQGVFFTKVRQ